MNARQGGRGFPRTRLLTAAHLLALGVFCPVLAATWPDWAVLPGDDLVNSRYGDEDAVIVSDQWDISVKGGQRKGTRRRVSLILTEDGRAESILPLARGSFDTFSRVKIWIRDPGGRVRFLGEDEGTLLSASAPKILDDTEVLVLEPRAAGPGSAMAVEYSFSSTPDIPQDVFRIQGPVPVLKAEVRVDARGGWRVQARVVSGPNPGPSELREQGVWSFADIPGRPAGRQRLSPEPPRLTLALDYIPPGAEAAFRDWAATTQWGVDLFRSPEPSGLVEAAADKLRSAGGDLIEAAGRFTRRLRYFAIEIGWGGYRPRPSDTTLARGFGDCKDKSKLMVDLLRRLGFEAFPVLAVAPSHRYAQEDLPSPRHFDHCIVGIPWKERPRSAGMCILDAPGIGPVRIFDPTLSDASAQDIHVALEGGAALPLDDRVGWLLRLPASKAEENLLEQTHRWRFDEEQTLHVQAQARHHGSMRSYLEGEGGEVITRKDLRRDLYRSISRDRPLPEDFEASEVTKDAEGFWSYSLRYCWPQAFARYGDLSVVNLPPFLALDRFPVPNEKKAASLYQPFLATYRQRYEIDLSGTSLVTPPGSFTAKNSLGSVSVVVSQEGDHLLIEQTMVVGAREIPPGKRDEVLALRQALRRANSLALVFVLDTPASPPGG